ncbi:MAG: adenylate/guanylate cyclase domain-containing protein, partial [Actinomycetota bacterium]
EEIAFASVGSGPPLVLAAWWTSHLELDWQNDELRDFVLALAEHHTVVRYDRPGVGMSERVDRPYDLETDVAHLEAVVDAVAAGPVDLLGISCGGPACIELAARRPAAVRRLVFFASYVTGAEISDASTRLSLKDLVAANWGLASVALSSIFLPDADGITARRFASTQRHTTSAEVACDLLQLTFDLDASQAVGRVEQPALVLHRSRDLVVPVEVGRDLAERLPAAEFVEMPGQAHVPWAGPTEAEVELISRFLDGGAAPGPVHRRLATIVFVDVVGSTDRLTEVGDRRWRELLDGFAYAIDQEVAHRGGTVVKDTGDGALVSFDLPGDAIAFADGLRRRVGQDGHRVRVGIHTGEVEQRGDDLTGRAVVIAARLCDLAPSDAVLVTSTTAELAGGRGFRFTDVGPRTLKGIPEPVAVLEAQPDGRRPDDPAPDRPAFHREGATWKIDLGGRSISVPHSKGIADLAVHLVAGGPGTGPGTVHEHLDRNVL